MSYRDRGHYYVDGVLIDGMSKVQCRQQGGIPSVTTKIANWASPNLMFWKIEENLKAAYEILDVSIGMSFDDFKKAVADEYYRVHNEIKLGTAVHEILDKLIKNSVESRLFMSFYQDYADPSISELFESVQLAYDWFKSYVKQGISESIVYDKTSRIAGTCDVNGRIITPDNGEVVGGVDWKCSYVKKHPGWRKKDNVMKSLGFKKTDDYRMQLGAYGKVLEWEGAYIVKISTNPMVPGIQPMFFPKEELVKGYTAYAHVARAWDILNGYT